MKPTVFGVLALALVAMLPPPATATVKVVTTLSSYSSIAEFVGGARVEVHSISRGDEDAHFVKPKPSFALLLKDADVFVTTGLDLELWAPTLVDKSGNRSIRDGQDGFVSASQGVPLLDVPAVADRSAGDVHIYGNPHIFTSPLNAKIIAANIAAGLERVDPAGAATYRANLAAFQEEIDRRMFGEPLVEALGGQVLDDLARQGRLIAFLESQSLGDRPLLDQLSGWLGKGRAFRDKHLVAYHKNWIYLTEIFHLDVVGYVEPKPGIPPSAKHVHDLIQEIEDQRIEVLLAANYFSKQKVEAISERTGIKAIRVPMGPGVEGVDDYFALVDLWIDSLAEAFGNQRYGE
jgi:zinc/manganese transport system substrate-binding protein